MRVGLTISQVAGQCGISRTALLYYHRRGLLHAAGRTAGNYRWYSPADVERVRQICLYRKMGIPLKEIRSLLDQPHAHGKTESILRRRLQTLAHQADELRQQECEILQLLKHMAVSPHAPRARARAAERANSSVPFLENIMVTKKRWVEIMDAAGFGEAEKKRWHAMFEKMEPQGHREFLESLGMNKDEVEKVRTWSRSN